MKLILASQSAIRANLLQNAGLKILIDPAHIDERDVEKQAADQGATPCQIAQFLAIAKAQAIHKNHPTDLILGADQTLSLQGQRFSKPHDRAAARLQLQQMRGKTHILCSGASLVREGVVLWSGVSEAKLHMRDFSDAFLENYLDKAGEQVQKSVGAYQLEGVGIQLFERIEGDYFTILGLPLLQILQALRDLSYMEV